MKEQLCEAFCGDLSMRTLPAGTAVSTGFLSPDGDRIGFLVRTLPENLYRIQDSGRTLPQLEANGLNFSSGFRHDAMQNLLAEYGVLIDEEDRPFAIDGIVPENLGQSALRFVAFSLRVRDFVLMTEARVLGSFRDDVAKRLRETIGDKGSIEEKAAILPELSDFVADFVIRAQGRPPVGVFLGTSDARVLEAIVVRMKAVLETKSDVGVIALLEREKNVTTQVRQNAMNRLTAVALFRGREDAAIERIAHEAIGQSIH